MTATTAPPSAARASSAWRPMDEMPMQTVVQVRDRSWRIWITWRLASGGWGDAGKPDGASAPVRWRRACSLAGVIP